MIVRTDVRNHVRESDKSNNAATSDGTMTVDVPELQLGVPYNFTLDTNQERYHKVNTPADETLLYTLTTSNQNSSLELFAREGTMVSRSAFDFLFDRPGEANQEIVVPNTESDVYYDLVRGAYVPDGPASVTIKAESVPFSIRSVTPNRIGDNGQVTVTIHGARFQDGAAVELVGNGTTLTAATVTVLDSATAKARFLFTSVPHGLYDLRLTNPGDNATTSQGAVSIETAMPLLLDVNATGDAAPRIGRRLSLNSTLRNIGNVDAPYVSVTAFFTQAAAVQMGIARPNTTLPRQSDQPEANWAEDSPTSTRLGDITLDSFIVRDLEVNAEIPFTITIRGYRATPYKLFIDTRTSSTEEFYTLLQGRAVALRETLLSSNMQFPDTIAQALASDASWWQYTSDVLSDAGWLTQSNSARPTGAPMRSQLRTASSQSDCALFCDFVSNSCVILSALNCFVTPVNAAFCVVQAFLPPLNLFKWNYCNIATTLSVASCGDETVSGRSIASTHLLTRCWVGG